MPAGTIRGLDAAALQRLAARGSSLDERMTGAYVAAASTEADTARAAARVARWRRLAASADSSAFAFRLAAYGVSLERATSLLAAVRLSDGAPLPDWVSGVDALAQAVTQTAPRRPGSPPAFIAPATPVPFEEILAPLVAFASARLRVKAGDDLTVLGTPGITALQRGLLLSLAGLAGPCLYQEFAAYRGARLSGLAGLLEAAAAEKSSRLVLVVRRSPARGRFLRLPRRVRRSRAPACDPRRRVGGDERRPDAAAAG